MPLSASHRPSSMPLTLFLLGMPVVYLLSADGILNSPGRPIELLGLAIYGGLAIASYFLPPPVLAAGILFHGIGWDSWHYGNSSYIPNWYAAGCLIADVGIALFALSAPGQRA